MGLVGYCEANRIYIYIYIYIYLYICFVATERSSTEDAIAKFDNYDYVDDDDDDVDYSGDDCCLLVFHYFLQLILNE